MFNKINVESIRSVRLVLSSVFLGPNVYFAGYDDEGKLAGIFYEKEWKEFCMNFLDIVKEWKKENYVDYTILDGTQWSLIVLTNDMKEIRISGSNKFPNNFGKLKKLMSPYPRDRNIEEELFL
jgi:hypothetical protein